MLLEPIFPRFNWNDLKIFLICAECGSFREAATRMRVSSSTVTRRIERLEEDFNTRLFERLPDGISLTTSGQEILADAKAMEAASFKLHRSLQVMDENEYGQVSIGLTEGLATYWVAPKLYQFQRHNTKLQINLVSGMDVVNLNRMETDIAIQLERPTNNELIQMRLGRLHIYPFATQQYIRDYGAPKQVKDLLHHRIVYQEGGQIKAEALKKALGIESLDQLMGMRTNSSTAHYEAIAHGVGIGALPNYALALGASLVPVDLNLKHSLDIWLVYHPQVRHVPRVMNMINWIKDIFDDRAYAWFGDRFIHPSDLIPSPHGYPQPASPTSYAPTHPQGAVPAPW